MLQLRLLAVIDRLHRETLRKRAVSLERVMGAETRVLFRCFREVSPVTGTLPKYEMSNLFPTHS